MVVLNIARPLEGVFSPESMWLRDKQEIYDSILTDEEYTCSCCGQPTHEDVIGGRYWPEITCRTCELMLIEEDQKIWERIAAYESKYNIVFYRAED